MNHSLRDRYNRVSLEPLKIYEIEKMRKLRNENREWFISKEIITSTQQREWYNNYLKKENDFMFSVYYKNTDIWIGVVGLYDILNREAEFGRIMIDGKLVNEKGLGLEATICVCKIGFSKLDIDKIKLEVFSNNFSAINTYKKAGFEYVNKIRTDSSILNMELLNKNFNYIERR